MPSPVLTAQSWFSYTGFPFLAVQSCLSFPGPVLTVGCLILSVLSWLSSPGCHDGYCRVLAVMSWPSCPYFLSRVSYPGGPVRAVLS
jgi:hypothetical protein